MNSENEVRVTRKLVNQMISFLVLCGWDVIHTNKLLFNKLLYDFWLYEYHYSTHFHSDFVSYFHIFFFFIFSRISGTLFRVARILQITLSGTSTSIPLQFFSYKFHQRYHVLLHGIPLEKFLQRCL